MVEKKLVAIDRDARELTELLDRTISGRVKLNRLVEFFSFSAESLPAELLYSFYLEFYSAFLALIHEKYLVNSDPEYLLDIRKILISYRQYLGDEIRTEELQQAFHKVDIQIIRGFLILEEWDAAGHVLELATGNNRAQQVIQSLKEEKRDPYRFLIHLSQNARQLCPACIEMLDEIYRCWTSDFFQPLSNRINLIFVEKIRDAGITEGERGLILPVSLQVRIRPRDYQEDIIQIGRQVSILTREWEDQLNQAVIAAKKLCRQFYSPRIAGRYYSFYFMLPEEQARFVGNSSTVSLALLSLAGLINAYYNKKIITLKPDTLVTAALDDDGNLEPVSETGLISKIETAFFSPVRRVVVSWQNLTPASRAIKTLKNHYPNRHLILEVAQTLIQLIDDQNVIAIKKPSLLYRAWSFFIRNIRTVVFTLTVLGLILAGIYLNTDFLKDRNPVFAEVEGSFLIVKNAKGQRVWMYKFPFKFSKRFYDKFQIVKIADVNSDGKNEVLLGIYEHDEPERSGWITLFSFKGEVIWTRKTGREMVFGETRYSNHFRIFFIDVKDLNHDGKFEILTISHHWPYFPCCINIWNVNGDKLAEYWHAGQISHLNYRNMDGEDDLEILATGQNNGWKCAVLAVLKWSDMTAASPFRENGDYRAQGWPVGRELAYIRVPQSTIFQQTHSRDYGNKIINEPAYFQLEIENGALYSLVGAERGIICYYNLTSELKLLDFSFSDLYARSIHVLNGRTPTESDESRMRRLLYFDGEKWVPKPIWTKFWRDRTNSGQNTF